MSIPMNPMIVNRSFLPILLSCWIVGVLCELALSDESHPTHPTRFGIHVVDQNGMGVPLVELTTVDNVHYVTDNGGWIAWDEPGWMDQEVFWHVSGPGVTREADGFGFRGFRARTTPGTHAECRVTTTNIAVRVGRLTGQGLYRDSELLGLRPTDPTPSGSMLVSGQDSAQAVVYGDKLFWLWGDTNVPSYPLGNFQTTCATADRNSRPEEGIRYQCFTDATGSKLRPMMPMREPGVVWLFGLTAVPGKTGMSGDPPNLYAGFTRRKGLDTPYENGIAQFDPDAGVFRTVANIDKENEYDHPHGCATSVEISGTRYVYFCRPFASSRVKEVSIAIPTEYEHLVWNASRVAWEWKRGVKPTSSIDEMQWFQEGKVPKEQLRYHLVDVESDRPVRLHTGSIRWNEYRKCYVLIAVEISKTDTPSHLGEVWYSESSSIEGPWTHAIKIATHPGYSFYNPVHHPFLDREGGRILYFEGTYTAQFSSAKSKTPRYDYNQLMYRLDLQDPRLRLAQKKWGRTD